VIIPNDWDGVGPAPPSRLLYIIAVGE
jgi:hypothetical protein